MTNTTTNTVTNTMTTANTNTMLLKSQTPTFISRVFPISPPFTSWLVIVYRVPAPCTSGILFLYKKWLEANLVEGVDAVEFQSL